MSSARERHTMCHHEARTCTTRGATRTTRARAASCAGRPTCRSRCRSPARPSATTTSATPDPRSVRAVAPPVRGVRQRPDRGRGQPGPAVPQLHLLDHLVARPGRALPQVRRGGRGRRRPRAGSLVVDVGSNDGSLLRAFRELGYRVVGVDPAVEIADRATGAGIPTVPEYFTPAVAARIRDEHGPARLVTANNVFAHSDQLPAMADAVRDLLAPDGVFTFEVSYLLDIVQKMLFDTVYHEHLCYHSVRSLRWFFAAARPGTRGLRANPDEGRLAAGDRATSRRAAAGLARGRPARRVGRHHAAAQSRHVPRLLAADRGGPRTVRLPPRPLPQRGEGRRRLRRVADGHHADRPVRPRLPARLPGGRQPGEAAHVQPRAPRPGVPAGALYDAKPTSRRCWRGTTPGQSRRSTASSRRAAAASSSRSRSCR